MKNSAIFIDAEYVLQSMRTLTGRPRNKHISKDNINWKNLISHISSEYNVCSTYYYTAKLDPIENEKTYNQQKEYLSNIERLLEPYNINLRLGKMIKIKNKSEKTWNKNRENYQKNHNSEYTWGQKGIDTKIVLDVLDMIINLYENKYDIFVLIAGDEDFAEALEFIKSKDKKVELVSFDRYDSKLSECLKAIPNKTTILDYNMLQEIDVI